MNTPANRILIRYLYQLGLFSFDPGLFLYRKVFRKKEGCIGCYLWDKWSHLSGNYIMGHNTDHQDRPLQHLIE
ncbi:MAG: hypothetical protein ABI372_07410 [Ginsengibacter sp.]